MDVGRVQEPVEDDWVETEGRKLLRDVLDELLKLKETGNRKRATSAS